MSAAIGVSGAAAAQSAEDGEILVVGERGGVGDISIGNEALDRRAPDTLQQVFAGETAVLGGGASTASQKIFVHGIEQSQLNVTVDGVRQGSAVYHHATNAILDPALYKSVDVKPGVTTADTGPAAVAGSIAFETKDARDLLGPDDSVGGMASISWESNGSRFRETGAVYGLIGNVDYLAAGSGYQGQDHEDGDGVRVTKSEPSINDFIGKLGYTSTGGHRFEATGQVTGDSSERQRRPDFGGLTGGPPNPIEDYAFVRQAYTLSYEDQSGEGAFAPSAQLNYQYSETDTELLWGEYTSVSGKLNGDVDVGIGMLSLGGDFYIDENRGSAHGAPFRRARLKEEAENVGLYAQARLDPLEWASLSIGVRGDQQWFTGINGEEFDDNGVSGNATLEISPVDWLTFDVGASHVWGGYVFGEAGLYASTASYTGFKPSTSDNYRAGVTVSHSGFTAGLSVFLTQIDDASDRSGTARGDTADIESKGVDAMLGYSAEKGFVSVKYTFADVTEDGATPSTTNFFQAQPMGHVFGVEAGFSPMEGLRLGGDAQIALENEDTVGIVGLGSTVGTKLDAYEVVNLHAEYEPPQIRGVSFRAEVNNVFDEAYASRAADGGGQGALIVPLNEPGRSFGLSAKVKF